MITEACRQHLPAVFRDLRSRLVDEDLGAACHAGVPDRPVSGGEVRGFRAETASARFGELLLREGDRVGRVRRVAADARRLVAARERVTAERGCDRDKYRLDLALLANLHRVTCGIADRDLVRQGLDLDALEFYARASRHVNRALGEGLRGERLGRFGP